MRKKKLILNTISSIILQIVTVACGFIIPKLILENYGSDVNGLISSITQFLGIISFVELGIGSVVQSALYKPLANDDIEEISKIISSAQKFFSKIAIILCIYIILLIVSFNLVVKTEFNWLYIAVMIFAIGISSFAQYYFGIVDRILLIADQNGYLQYSAQVVAMIFNTILCIILIDNKFSIHIVKLASSSVYLIMPIIIRLIINKNYKINRKIKYEGEPIKQKWNGVAQHISAIVLDNTDNIVLTIFANMKAVSIYSVYNIIVFGLKQLLFSLTSGIQSLIGELWAKNEKEKLYTLFSNFDWIIHTITTVLFGCASVLIVPFISIYTKNINDANYIQPVFAILITIANGLHCLRLPYNIMILSGGHYKQTQNCYIIAALMNLIISIIMVKKIGLIGVAVGTVVSMLYQTIWMAYYVSNNLIKWSFKNFIKQCLVDVCIFIVSFCVSLFFDMIDCNYLSWIVLAAKVLFVWVVISILINYLFYKEKLAVIFQNIQSTVKRMCRC